MIMNERLFYYIMVFIGLMGLCVGSFLNVVIYRLPAGLSVATPASRCGACEHPIRPYDNIPVLSWLILRGRCRDCKTSISPRYAIVELLTGLLAVLTWAQLPGLLSPAHLNPSDHTLKLYAIVFLLRFIFICLMITIAFIDFDHFIIPHRLTIAGMIIGLSVPWVMQWLLGNPNYLTFWPPMMPIMSVVGLILGVGFIILIFYLYLAIRGVVGLGGGDAMLMGMVGAWLGIPGIVFVCFAASVQGLLAAAISSLFGLSFVTDSRTLLGDENLDVAEGDMIGVIERHGHLQDDNENLETSACAESTIKNTEGVQDVATDGAAPKIDDETIQNDETNNGNISYAAIPFGPFIALSALEFLLLGNWFPEYISMVRIYFVFL